MCYDKSVGNNTKLILFCGLPGSGKTTLAKKFEQEGRGVRLNTDEWMADLGLDPMNEIMHTKMQDRLWKLAKELLQLGQSVILENGLWTRFERDAKRFDAEKLKVSTELHYMNIPLEELIRRLESRNLANAHGHAVISKLQIEEYSKIFEVPSEQEFVLFSQVIIH